MCIMKKLLILVMVLAMASLASATLSFSVSGTAGSEAVSLNAVGEISDGYWGVSVSGDDATIGTFVVGVKAPTISGVFAAGTDAGMPNGELWLFATANTDEAYQDGSWLTAAITRTAAATLHLWTYTDGDPAAVETTVELLVPEPMTIALLGLGGLLLRRRMA
jgi:hypothetical protein